MENRLYGPDNKPIPIDEEVKELPPEQEKEIPAFLKYHELVEIKGFKFRVESTGGKMVRLKIVGPYTMGYRKDLKKRKQT